MVLDPRSYDDNEGIVRIEVGVDGRRALIHLRLLPEVPRSTYAVSATVRPCQTAEWRQGRDGEQPHRQHRPRQPASDAANPWW